MLLVLKHALAQACHLLHPHALRSAQHQNVASKSIEGLFGCIYKAPQSSSGPLAYLSICPLVEDCLQM